MVIDGPLQTETMASLLTQIQHMTANHPIILELLNRHGVI